MPRPLPAPENKPERRTVSIRAKVSTAADSFRVAPEHEKERIRDFSDLVERAIEEYVERRHPGLIAQCAKEIRESSQTLTYAVAAESSANYTTAKQLPSPTKKRDPHKKGRASGRAKAG